MNTLRNRLTNLLTLNRSVFKRPDTEAGDHSSTHSRFDAEDKVLATQLESQQAANDSDDRPDWFQAIHGSEYYNE